MMPQKPLERRTVLKTETVFVLGAGASVPFGFPTGLSLTRLVVEHLEGKAGLYGVLTNILKLDGAYVEQFCKTLLNSGKNSIDAFLEHRPDYMDVGKAAIAAALINYEVPRRIMEYAEDNWLRYMYSHLSANFDEFSENKLSIITFNYDRIVEWFLLTSLQNSFDKPTMQCLTVLKPKFLSFIYTEDSAISHGRARPGGSSTIRLMKTGFARA
jgi:hypothetical protein